MQRLAHPQGVRSLGDLCGSGVRVRRALKPVHRKTKNRDNTHSGLSKFRGTEPKLGQPWENTGRTCLTSDCAKSKQEDEWPSHSLLVSRNASTLGYYYFYFLRRDIKKQISRLAEVRFLLTCIKSVLKQRGKDGRVKFNLVLKIRFHRACGLFRTRGKRLNG